MVALRTNNVVRILVADEPSDWVSGFVEHLKPVKVEVVYAHNEHQGLEILQHERVNLAFVAGDIPTVNGLDFVRRAHRFSQELPVILLGIDHTRRWIEEALRVGAMSVFPRPVNIERLIAITGRLLNSRSAISE
jgi:DNA-binding NtrC family response regulator